MTRVAAIMFLSGCGAANSWPLKITPTSQLVTISNDAAAAINEAAGTIVVTLNDVDGVPVLVDTTPDQCGAYDMFYRAIAVHRDCIGGDDSARLALVHEIGHALGLEHSDDKSSIMYRELIPGMSLNDAAKSLMTELRANGFREVGGNR